MNGTNGTYAELEIGLSCVAGVYQVELRYTDPKNAAEISPLRGETSLDPNELLPHQLDSEEYGKCLGEALFPETKIPLPSGERTSLRAHYRQIATAVQQGDLDLRLRLRLDPSASNLQALRWETLCDPESGVALATSEKRLFSRYMASHLWRPVQLRPRSKLTALVAIAAPSDLASYQLAAVEREGEIDRALTALEGVAVKVAGEPLTLERLADDLRGGVDVLYLVCHGALNRTGEPALFLQNVGGTTAMVRGVDLTRRLAELQRPPRLVVLASCESGGTEAGTDSMGEATAQSSLAPLLAEAGVAAVVAMQGKITMETVKQAMPVFFRELLVDGQIDRAMAAARGAVKARPDHWMPALYLRLKGGRIWYEAAFATNGEGFDKWDAVVTAIKNKSITPVIGSGLYEHVFGTHREIARRLAVAADFPLSPHRFEELPQVAQYYRVSQDKATLRSKVKEILATAIRERHPDAVRKLGDASLSKLVRAAAEHLWQDNGDEPHRILARLPCTVYISVNHDDLLALALKREDKKPDVRICRFRENPSGEQPEPPLIQKPLVFHMLGHFRAPDSLVLTQDDYFDFLVRVSRDDKHVPSKIDATTVKTILLFLGFELDDWSFRVLFRRLKSLGGQDLLAENTHVMVQVSPVEEQIDPERARRFLAQYFPDQQLSKASIYWGTAAEFLRELNTKLAGITLPTDNDDDHDDY